MKHALKGSPCPNCGVWLDRATNAEHGDDRPPDPEGSVTICAECLMPAQYGKGLKLEKLDIAKLSREDLKAIADAQAALRVQRSLRRR